MASSVKPSLRGLRVNEAGRGNPEKTTNPSLRGAKRRGNPEKIISPLSTQQGFSLIELMATLVIFSILVALSVAIGKNFISDNRSTSSVNTLISNLYYARSEAVTRGEKIIFCKSVDQKSCSGHWSDGQIVTTVDKKILRVFPALPGSDTLVWSGSLGKNDSLEWLPTGYTNGQRGSFYYCSPSSNAKASRSVVVLNTGRVYSAEVSEADYNKYCKL